MAVPLLAIVAPESIASVEPDSILNVFAVNLKSSAPAILISIWSSVSAVIVVSPSSSSTNSLPSKSLVATTFATLKVPNAFICNVSEASAPTPKTTAVPLVAVYSAGASL